MALSFGVRLCLRKPSFSDPVKVVGLGLAATFALVGAVGGCLHYPSQRPDEPSEPIDVRAAKLSDQNFT